MEIIRNMHNLNLEIDLKDLVLSDFSKEDKLVSCVVIFFLSQPSNS